jgi:adenylate kinase
MSLRVIFLGPPGADKGTQASALAQEWGVPHVATGDMLREAAARGTRLGLEARRYMDTGALVPDEVVIGLVGERLHEPDAAKGAVLDGFPRTVAQAEALDRLLRAQGAEIDRVVFLDVGSAELLRRLTGRRICRAAAPHHVVFVAAARRTSAIGAEEAVSARGRFGGGSDETPGPVAAKHTAPRHYGPGGHWPSRGEARWPDIGGHPQDDQRQVVR